MYYSHLSVEERFCIYKMLYEKKSIRAIAHFLSRSPSTISREMNRNTINKLYWYDGAQHLADQRKAYSRSERRKAYAALYDLVIKSLIAGLSPDVIAGRLKREYHSLKMRVSHETIYQWILSDAKAGGVLYKLLPRSHKKRYKQGRSKRRREFKDRVGIDKRPKAVENKIRFGDWESDTMEGARSLGGLATHVERKSCFLVAGRLKDKRSSTFMDVTIGLFKSIDKRIIKTFTTDNGSEFAEFKRLEKATESRVYFAEPYSPWQRGLNENTNGLLRRYFPKGCNFHEIDDNLIQRVVNQLNHRPRKSLKYRTPYEVLFKTRSVALRT
jgi:IS30 family transposase